MFVILVLLPRSKLLSVFPPLSLEIPGSSKSSLGGTKKTFKQSLTFSAFCSNMYCDSFNMSISVDKPHNCIELEWLTVHHYIPMCIIYARDGQTPFLLYFPSGVCFCPVGKYCMSPSLFLSLKKGEKNAEKQSPAEAYQKLNNLLGGAFMSLPP